MKLTFNILFLGLFVSSQAIALNVMQKVNSPENCPESLQVQISSLNGTLDQFKVEILFLPEPGDTKTVRVFNKLMVIKDGEVLADAPLDLIKEGQYFRSQFRLHRSALEQSKVSVSMYLVGRGNVPVLGGGYIYEISLKGFIVRLAENLPSGVDTPLIKGEETP